MHERIRIIRVNPLNPCLIYAFWASCVCRGRYSHQVAVKASRRYSHHIVDVLRLTQNAKHQRRFVEKGLCPCEEAIKALGDILAK
ncbi:MAG: hypothetical protein FWG87_13415 [Defluviitaleaceae bacterium]|nr:hypothetical protein [Defluviitaleaceae bacterium]